jgi:hypothetical protein
LARRWSGGSSLQSNRRGAATSPLSDFSLQKPPAVAAARSSMPYSPLPSSSHAASLERAARASAAAAAEEDAEEDAASRARAPNP